MSYNEHVCVHVYVCMCIYVCVCVCVPTHFLCRSRNSFSSTKFHAFYHMILGQRKHKYSSSGQILALSQTDEKVMFTVFISRPCWSFGSDFKSDYCFQFPYRWQSVIEPKPAFIVSVLCPSYCDLLAISVLLPRHSLTLSVLWVLLHICLEIHPFFIGVY